MNSRRYHEVDFMYTLGVILVLIGHSHSSDWTKIYGTPIEYIISFIYAFHMPLFFSISGFLFMNSHKIEKIGYWKYIADKGIKLFVPYFFLSLIVLFPKMHSDTGSFFDINYIYVHFSHLETEYGAIYGSFLFCFFAMSFSVR